MKQIIFDGHKFTKDNKTGYYLKTTKPRMRLHIYVWEYYNKCKVPKGFDIHHIDKNKDNNDISNLVCISRKRHNEIHREGSKDWTDEQWKEARDRMNYAREFANSWHKSEEGREWHRTHYKISLSKCNNTKIKKICECCGKEYEVIKSCASRSRFCSNVCKSRWRRASGIDNVIRKCKGCGRYYEVNKYYADEQKYCSVKCANKYGRK